MLISFLRGKDNSELFLGNRRVLKIGEGKKYWKKVFTEAKSGGAKKLRLRTADNVVGLSEIEILKITAKSPRFRSFNIKFKNQAILRPVRVNDIQTQHQIDLANLNEKRVEYQGTVHRHVLSIMEIFSGFHWLAQVKSDIGLEFKKESKLFTLLGGLEKLIVMPIILNHRVKLNFPTES